ncbi:MAG: hypothetical protein IJ092_03420 [Atopobiaceae bacterium]|nr:hypothetical protein [Atopobiaceae bacterium]MBR1830389.1 hypothetical protein [Atopobiaceae bacterium]
MKKYAKGFAVLFAVMVVFALAACGSGSAGSKGIPDNPGNVYRAIVQDESGAPVKGVTVQFCSDSMCYTGETDDSGIVTLQIDEFGYTVHVLSVPEGFAEDTTEYPAPTTFGDVAITLKKA